MSGFPTVFRLRQHFDDPQLDDVPGEVDAQLSRLNLGEKIRSGDTVAITAGSRGITNMPVIIRAAADHLKRLGAEPFIVPAMGSHGGGTAAGQHRVIESYGITEESCGCPIRAGMDTVVVREAVEGFPASRTATAGPADPGYHADPDRPD